MERKIVLKKDLLDAFQKVGVKAGQTVMVHCSLSALGFVCGGAQVVIEALMESVGEDGTLMMPTQSWKNLDPTSGVHWQEPQEWWQLIRDNWPAWGRYAQFLTENHDLSNIFGDGSPIGKLYELDGYVLLIGVGYDKNTSLHLADVRADYPGKHNTVESSAILENGVRVWKSYETLFVDGEDFDRIGQAFEASCHIAKAALGNGTVTFMRQRDLVDFAVRWIRENRK